MTPIHANIITTMLYAHAIIRSIHHTGYDVNLQIEIHHTGKPKIQITRIIP